MTGPVWLQVVFVVAAGAPIVVVTGLLITMAVGGVLGCAECACCRLGFTKLSPGIDRTWRQHAAAA